MKELKGLKSGSYESEANGSILEARLYNTGVREVLEKINQSNASVIYHSDHVFKNAHYPYTTRRTTTEPRVPLGLLLHAGTDWG